jgi:hypothetical protein
MIAVATYTSEDEMRQAYAERRQRLMNAPTPAACLMALDCQVKVTKSIVPVRASQSPAVDYILEECAKHNVTLAELRVRSRASDRIVMLRGEIFYTLRMKFKWKYPAIGKYFRKDHHTVFHNIGVYCGATGEDRGPVQGRLTVTPELLEDLKRRFLSGQTMSQAARACGIPQTTAFKHAKKAGWYVERPKTSARRHHLPKEEIGRLYQSDMLMKDIAERYNVSVRTLMTFVDDNGWPKRGRYSPGRISI